jgi:phage terminase small subunit
VSEQQPTPRPMPPQVAKFVQLYLTNGHNATRAAEGAGYSAKTAKQQGSRLLTRVDVQAAIKARVSTALEKAESQTAEIVEETDALLEQLVKVAVDCAIVDAKDFYDDTGKLLHVKDMPERARIAVHQFDFEEERLESSEGTVSFGRTTKIRTYDRLRAIEVIAKLKALVPPPQTVNIHNTQVNNTLNVYRWRTDEDDA